MSASTKKFSGFPLATLPLAGNEFVVLVQGGTTVRAPLNQTTVLANFAKASLPSPSQPGSLIYVTDDVGGAVPAFADGTNWRRVTDRNVIS